MWSQSRSTTASSPGTSCPGPALMRARNSRIASAARRHRFDREAPVPFLCECDHEGCEELVRLRLADYELARGSADNIVAPGHQIDGAKIVRVKDGWWLYRFPEGA
jgi:hypothetical protein